MNPASPVSKSLSKDIWASGSMLIYLGERSNNASEKTTKARLHESMWLQNLLERVVFRVNAIYGCYSW